MATVKQKKAVKALGENGGIISKAMETAEYAPSIIHATEKLTNSKGFKELMAKELPDGYLLKKLRAIIDKKELVVVSDGVKEGSHIEYTGQPHTDVIRGVDIAVKINGLYNNDGSGNTINIVVMPSEIINKRGIKTANPGAERNSELPVKVQGS